MAWHLAPPSLPCVAKCGNSTCYGAAAGKNMGRQAMGEDWIFGCHAMESVAAPAVRGDPSSPEPNTGAHNIHAGALPAASRCAAREGKEKGRAAPALLAMPCDGRRRHDVWSVYFPNFFGKVTVALFQSKIRRTKRDLIIKLITWMDGKSRDESIKPN